jgi:hypothetical protein
MVEPSITGVSLPVAPNDSRRQRVLVRAVNPPTSAVGVSAVSAVGLGTEVAIPLGVGVAGAQAASRMRHNTAICFI